MKQIVKLTEKRLAGVYFVVFIILGLIAYSRSIFPEYGRIDDFVIVVDSRGGYNFYREVFFNSGRWTSAIFAHFVFPYINSVLRLQYLRIICVLAVVCAATCLAVIASRIIDSQRSIIKCIVPIFVGLAAFNVPGGPNGITWGVQAVLLFAIPIALVAGLVATSTDGWISKHWFKISLILIVLSAFTYQHCVMIAVVPSILSNAIRWSQREKTYWVRSIVIYCTSLVALIANFLAMWIVGSESANRAFSSGFIDQLRWYLSTAIPRTVDLFVPDTSRTQIISLGILILLLLLPLVRGVRFCAISFGVLIGWAATASVIFATEMWASYRVIYPSQIALWGGAGVAVVVSLSHPSKLNPLIEKFIVLAVSAMAIFGLYVSSERAIENFATPNAIDWSAARCSMRREGSGSVIDKLVMSDMTDSSSEFLSYDEYGVITSSIDWAVDDMYFLTPEAIHRSQNGFVIPQITTKLGAVGQEGNLVVFADPMCSFDQ